MTIPQTPGAEEAAAATNRHYQQPPDVFAAFLGRRVKYTCGLFSTGTETLDEAQDSYLHYVARALALCGGERVLDVGCGWGSLTLFLAKEFGCRVCAVTPASAQAEYIEQRAHTLGVGHLVTLVVGPFQIVDLPVRFDAVAMVEVIEHMPEHGTSLAKTHRLLIPAGRLFLSATCYRSDTFRREFASRPASQHAVGLFGFTAMTPLSQLVAEIEDAGFSLTRITDTTACYDTTMQHWQHRIGENHAAMEQTSPGFADELSTYFDTARASWGYTAKHYSLTASRSRMGITEL